MKLNYLTYCILFSFSLNCFAQTEIKFKYEYSSSILPDTRISVLLKSSTGEIEFLNDTIGKFENVLNVLSKGEDYMLFVEFENNTIGKEALSYPFSLIGNEKNIEINVRFWKQSSSFDKMEKDNGSIEIIKYYDSNHNLDIKYLPKMKGNEYYKEPFFILKNSSNDTIYGRYLKDYFWGSISYLEDSMWSRDYLGLLDYNFVAGSPLFPDSATVAWVGSFGWKNELPKNHYRFTLLYTTDKNMSNGVKHYLEKDNFVWWADTKEYYRLIYEFDIE